MTVTEALIVCGILKKHGYGDLELTVECGYTSVGCYPDYLHIQHGYINMEGFKNNGKWNVADKTLIPVCEEIESALLEVEKSKRMTNLERFREMSAAELAMHIKVCPCEEKDIECDHDSCSQCREDWLYEEVQDDAD